MYSKMSGMFVAVWWCPAGWHGRQLGIDGGGRRARRCARGHVSSSRWPALLRRLPDDNDDCLVRAVSELALTTAARRRWWLYVSNCHWLISRHRWWFFHLCVCHVDEYCITNTRQSVQNTSMMVIVVHRHNLCVCMYIQMKDISRTENSAVNT